MREKMLPFSLPCIEKDDIQAVVHVLKSLWITTGPKAAEFEKAFGDYVGAPYACALTSATAGMHLALKALNIGKEDEVITPSMTWVSTLNLIDMAGAKPVLSDIDPSTLMMTPEMIKPLITPRTKAVIPVHFAGAPADMDGFRELSRQHGFTLIEDAAHSIGTEYKGKKIGAEGISIFSFHPIKNMTTGEGGMVCCHDEEFIRKIRRYKFHGMDKDAWSRYKKMDSPVVEVIEPGYKYNFLDLLAALGLTQLAKIEKMNSRREVLYKSYEKHLKNIEEIKTLGMPAYPHRHCWHLFIIQLDLEKIKMTRNEFIEELKKRNIGSGIHFHAAHLHQYFRENYGYQKGMLPHTEHVTERMLSLPLFPTMKEKDVKDVVNAIKDILAGVK